MPKPRSLLLSALLSGLAFSCQQKPPVQDKHYEYFASAVTPHARLELASQIDSSDIFKFTHYNYSVEPGENLVFELMYTQGDSALQDAGVTESAIFEIPDTATSFHLRDREFLAHNGLYRKSCFCLDSRANKDLRIDSGNKVAGRLLAPFTWLVHSEIAGINFTDTIDIRTKNVADGLK